MAKGIPRLERNVLTVAIGFVVIQLGLLAFAAIRLGITVPTCVTRVKPFDTAQFIPLAPDRYEIHVVAQMWQFSPGFIRVPKGSVVDFYLTSLDVVHGFFIGRTNANLMAVPGVVNYMQVHFTKPGRYPIVCHEYCGAGHHAMTAMVEVTDSNEPGSAGSGPAL